MKKQNKFIPQGRDKSTKSEKPLFQKGGVYFHSAAIIGKKNIFVTNEYLDLLVNAFKTAELQFDIKNLAYVIMPNYFNWMFKLSEKNENPIDVYGQMKKFLAKEILDNLKKEKEEGEYQVIDLFAKNDKVGRSKPEKILWTFEDRAKNFKNCKRYKVFAPKTEIRLIDNPELLNRKLDFMKQVPVSERWSLVAKAEDYPYLYICDELVEESETAINKLLTNFQPTMKLVGQVSV